MTTTLAPQARRTRCQVRRGRDRESGAVPRSAPARHLRGPRHRDQPESCRGRTPSPSPDVTQVPKHMVAREHLQLPDYLGSVHQQSRPAEPAKPWRQVRAGRPAKWQRAMRRREPETCVRRRLPTTTAPAAVQMESGRVVGTPKASIGRTPANLESTSNGRDRRSRLTNESRPLQNSHPGTGELDSRRDSPGPIRTVRMNR